MNSLGIYFGPKFISIAETKAKRLVNNIQIPQSIILPSGLEEKVPDEVKIVTILKDELKKNKIEVEEVTIALSGRDLIIRTFEMPILPREELNNAINFEVRKYIPFKVEDMISDFQVKKIDKYKRKNLVLFVGIKKESLDKYLLIIDRLGLKISSIEYSAFSILRLFTLANVGQKGVVGLVNIDLKEEDEINFMVLQDSFPLFSRDITLVGDFSGVTEVKDPSSGTSLEKLKKEIRISLDYYYRKFPTQKINTVYFITGQDYRVDLETFIKEMGSDIKFIDANKYMEKSVSFSLSLVKGYSSALSKLIKAPIYINLFLVKTRMVKEIAAPSKALAIPAVLFPLLKIERRILSLGLLICIATFIFGMYRIIPSEKELSSIIGIRPKISTIKPQASFEEIRTVEFEYKQKINVIENLLMKQAYLTEILDAIRHVISKDIWLVDFSFRKEENKTELILKGKVSLIDSGKELESVNEFLSNLKENPIFNKYFKQMEIVFIGQTQLQEATEAVTNFEIVCRGTY